MTAEVITLATGKRPRREPSLARTPPSFPVVDPSLTGDARIAALATRRRAIVKFVNEGQAGDLLDALSDETTDIEAQVFAAPAETIVGALIKATLAVEVQMIHVGETFPTVEEAYDTEVWQSGDTMWAAASIWADLQRLTGH